MVTTLQRPSKSEKRTDAGYSTENAMGVFSVEYPGVRTLGSFDGRLADSDEQIVLRDALNNPVDEVHYYDEVFKRQADL